MTARSGGAGSVVAYNFHGRPVHQRPKSLGRKSVFNGSHATGTHGMLFEGNLASNMDSDDTHGNAIDHTFFRNWADRGQDAVHRLHQRCRGQRRQKSAGRERAAACRGSHGVHLLDGVRRQRARDIRRHDRGERLGAQRHVYGVTDRQHMEAAAGRINRNINPIRTARPTRFRPHGNYDYYDSGRRAMEFRHLKPHLAQFLLSRVKAPSFFSAGSKYPWPWVTPTGTSPIQTGPSGCGGTCSGLPAKARYDASKPFVQP